MNPVKKAFGITAAAVTMWATSCEEANVAPSLPESAKTEQSNEVSSKVRYYHEVNCQVNPLAPGGPRVEEITFIEANTGYYETYVYDPVGRSFVAEIDPKGAPNYFVSLKDKKSENGMVSGTNSDYIIYGISNDDMFEVHSVNPDQPENPIEDNKWVRKSSHSKATMVDNAPQSPNRTPTFNQAIENLPKTKLTRYFNGPH